MKILSALSTLVQTLPVAKFGEIYNWKIPSPNISVPITIKIYPRGIHVKAAELKRAKPDDISRWLSKSCCLSLGQMSAVTYRIEPKTQRSLCHF